MAGVDGRELFFLSGDNHMMAVDVTLGGASPRLGTPKPLFQTAAVPVQLGPFDVTRDGKTFLVHSTSTVQAIDTPLTLVTNWTAEVRK